MTLKLIGYWIESDADRAYPHPKDLVDPHWHSDIRGKIAEYLLNGAVFNHSWGYSYCRFEDGLHQMKWAPKLTDGVFVWPEGLHIYVSKYHVSLPEEFVKHVKANNFNVPGNLRIVPEKFLAHMKANKEWRQLRIEGAEVDYDYWATWAADHISRE
jgi:hypothetical protein